MLYLQEDILKKFIFSKNKPTVEIYIKNEIKLK